MPRKLLPRKKWYTLQDAANFLENNTDDPSPIKQEDLLQYASEDSLTLAIKLFSSIAPETGQLLKFAQNQKSRMGLRSAERSSERWKDGKLLYKNTRIFVPNERLVPEHVIAIGQKEMEGSPITAAERAEVDDLMKKLMPESFEGETEFYLRSELIEGIGLVEGVDEDESKELLSQTSIWELFLNRNSQALINQIWRQCHATPGVPRDAFRVPSDWNTACEQGASYVKMELLFRDPTHKYVLRITPNHIPEDTLLGVLPDNLDALLDRPTPTRFEDEEHISDSLKGMNDAAFQFWKTAEKDQAGGQPTNPQVANWLEKHFHLSPSKAKHAASLIRPSWAADGRKPGKSKN